MKRIISVFVVVFLLIVVSQSIAWPSLNPELQKQMVLSNLSSMPLSFTENRGQWNEKALFKAEAGRATFFFCKDKVAYVFTRNTDELDNTVGRGLAPDSRHQDADLRFNPAMPDKFNHPRYKKESMVLYAKFIGGNLDAQIIGADRLGYNCNYFYGNDPSKWATDVPNYSSITYKNIYPGIDLKYHGDGRGMKYDFIVNPGADISKIRIEYKGVENLFITNQGDLEATTSFGPVHENIPEIYQEIEGNKDKVSGRYILIEPGVFGFEIDDYNPSYSLVIDPELVYSTYLGGNADDAAMSVAVSGIGEAYVTGQTTSPDFPQINPYQGYQDSIDVFVVKFTNGGSPVYCTYLGGDLEDRSYDIAINDNGNAFVVGTSTSTDFPLMREYQQDQPNKDAFVTELSPSGNSLIFSTYLGGEDSDEGFGVTVDRYDNIYLTGRTSSNQFPLANPFQETKGLLTDAFVTKFSPDGSLGFSTYLGGADNDRGSSIAVDAALCTYITGDTRSRNFPIIRPCFQGPADSTDSFVSKLSPSGDSMIYGTYLGGTGADYAADIAVDADGGAYVIGITTSVDFPLVNQFQSNQSLIDIFLTKFTPSGINVYFSTYMGGDGQDYGQSLAIDDQGHIYLTGYTSSHNFPLQDPYQDSMLGIFNFFVIEFAIDGQSLIYSTYIGGSVNDFGYGIAVDDSGNAYAAGVSSSSDFPTVNPYQPDQPGRDAVVLKFARVVEGYDYIPGDINGNGVPNGIDVVYGVNYLKGGPAPPYSCDCPLHGMLYATLDVNGSCATNGIDITFFVRFLKGQVPSLLYCQDCPPAR